MKTKTCPKCEKKYEVMYRVQTQNGKIWIFVCKDCLSKCQEMPDYRYGGTWKGYRH